MRRCKDAKMRKPTKYLQAQCHEDAKMRCCEDARHRLCPPSATVLKCTQSIVQQRGKVEKKEVQHVEGLLRESRHSGQRKEKQHLCTYSVEQTGKKKQPLCRVLTR